MKNLSFSFSLKNIILQKGNNLIFDKLNLDLSEKRIGLIGDNGAGKSSLFRLLCGLDEPNSGEINKNLVGLMFQNPDDQIIMPTVVEEIALSLRTQMNKKEAQVKSLEFLRKNNLENWAEKSIMSLSLGQRQFVCWLALQIANLDWLLLDEPFASLDLISQAKLSLEIKNAKQNIIISTHSLNFVRDFERVIWLDKGQIKADGIGKIVCQKYEENIQKKINNLNLELN